MKISVENLNFPKKSKSPPRPPLCTFLHFLMIFTKEPVLVFITSWNPVKHKKESRHYAEFILLIWSRENLSRVKIWYLGIHRTGQWWIEDDQILPNSYGDNFLRDKIKYKNSTKCLWSIKAVLRTAVPFHFKMNQDPFRKITDPDQLLFYFFTYKKYISPKYDLLCYLWGKYLID